MDVGRSLVKLTISGTVVLGSLALTAHLAGGGVVLPTILVTALGNVATGNTANAIDALTPGKESDRVSLENEHLTRAVGKAIAAVIVLAAKSCQGETHDKLMKIANYVQNNWVEIAQQEITQEIYPQLREANLEKFLTPDEYKLTQDGNLTKQDWDAIFRRLTIATCPKDRIIIDDRVGEKVAHSLHTTFPKALRETLKEDFAKHGEAFAGLTLQLLTGTKAELRKLQENQQEGFQSVLAQIQELETKLEGTAEQQQAIFTQISQQIESGFAEVCQQLGVMETTITGLLDSLRNYLEAKFEELSREVKELKGILLQLSLNPQIAYILGQSKEKLESIYKQIDKIMTYKRIHDLLHNLDFYYKTISHPIFDLKNIVNYQENYLWEMVSIIDKLQTECKCLEDNRQVTWLKKLTEASANISAVHQPDRSEKLSRSISRIKEVLEQVPTKINVELKSTVSDLKLLEISNTLEEICKNYIGDLSQKLKNNIDYLKSLKQYLDGLIKAHDYWQDIDSEINCFRNEVCYSNDVNYCDIKAKWNDLKNIFRGRKAANEHFKANNLKPKLNIVGDKFKLVQDKLDQLERTKSNIDDIKDIKEIMNGFCDSCHRYFDSVDHCLLDFCETKLKPIHRELENLLSNLNSRGV